MEIEVTHLMKRHDEMGEFSASRAERGNNAGPETWASALAEAEERPLITPDQAEELIKHFAEYGAWTMDELRAMTHTELNALLIQFVASEIREREAYPTLREWRKAQERGEC